MYLLAPAACMAIRFTIPPGSFSLGSICSCGRPCPFKMLVDALCVYSFASHGQTVIKDRLDARLLCQSGFSSTLTFYYGSMREGGWNQVKLGKAMWRWAGEPFGQACRDTHCQWGWAAGLARRPIVNSVTHAESFMRNTKLIFIFK